jgi:hypothetical protein
VIKTKALNDRIEEESGLANVRAALNRALRDLERAKVTKADLVQAVREAAGNAIAALEIPPVPKPARDKRQWTPEVAISLLSDWQLAKRTPTYNSDVCEKRVQLLGQKVARLTQIQRAARPIRECHIYLLGDLVEGEMIFPGQAHRIDASLYQQVLLDGPRILCGFIRKMASEFEKVHVVGVIGNHGAIGGRSRKDYHPETNADSMLYEVTKQLMAKEERVSWGAMFTPDERHWYAFDTIGEQRWLLIHGDQVRGYSGIPWYGFDRKVPKWFMSFMLNGETRFHHLAHGHFHTPVQNFINGAWVWGNGSTEDYNTYALEQLAAAGEPCQRLIFAHPRRGVTLSSVVNLSEA